MMNKSKGNMYSFVTHTWNTIKGKCPHDCEYCLPAETSILMNDFTTKRISDIKKGDILIGLESKKEFKKFGKSEVLNISNHKARTIIIKTDSGSIECTPEHPLYGSSNKRNCIDWRQAKIFSPYDLLRFLGMPKQESSMHKVGWMIGFIDGDGCFFKHYNKEKKQYLGFEAVCVDEKLSKSFIDCCYDFGITLKKGSKTSAKKSFNAGKNNPLIFSRASENVKKLKELYENYISNDFELVSRSTLDGCISDFFEGYIGGLLDTDGSVSKTSQVRISQSKTANPDVYARLIRALHILDMKYMVEKSGVLLKGGFPMRSKILFSCRPKHSVKSHNLIQGFSVKGTYKAEVQSIQRGQEVEVYNIETSTGNYIANGFIVHNCYMKIFRQNKLHFDESELKTDLGKDNFIFVGSSCDMFSNDVDWGWIMKTLKHCSDYPDNKYLFQTKNPENVYGGFLTFMSPKNMVIGTTVETNRVYPAMGRTISPERRAFAMSLIKKAGFETMLTIEPIMDFDLEEFLSLIKLASPDWVNIGADSKYHGLPEPPREKIELLIKGLQEFTVIKKKNNLGRIMSSGD